VHTVVSGTIGTSMQPETFSAPGPGVGPPSAGTSPRLLSVRRARHRVCARQDQTLSGRRHDHRELYLDLLTHYLEEGAPRAFRVIMNSPAFEYKSNFARRNFDRGKRAGREEGRIQERVELVLKIMTFRFGTLTKETQTRVRGA